MNNVDLVNLSKKIKAFRLSKGLKQFEFADLTLSSRSRISEYESGKGCPSFEFFIHLVAAFPDVDVNYFLGDDRGSVRDQPAGYSVSPDRKQRVSAFVDDFFESASLDEQAWLEVQLRLHVPFYNAFIEREGE